MRAPRLTANLGGATGMVRELGIRAHLARANGVGHELRRVADDLRCGFGERIHETAVRDMWAAAARACGAEIEDLGEGFLEVSRGSSRARVKGQLAPLNDEVSVELVADRGRLYRLLAAAGLDVPEHHEFDRGSVRDALAFLDAGPTPCVVKPTRGGGGLGVTCQLERPADVRLAVRWAGRFSDRVLIERETEGAVVRILVLDGIVIDALRRHPPSVTGDGESSVAQLVEREYERRLRARSSVDGSRFDPVTLPFVIDLDSLFTLRRDGLSPKSVPGREELVRVKTVTMQNNPNENEPLRPLPESLADLAIAAARASGLPLAGIDIVIPDERLDAAAGARVIDVNARPGLWHHYRVADASASTDVAAVILQRLLGSGRALHQ
jgi:D-alanine-D-alanine ligase-like ATP-grasp enzyme